MGIKGLRRPLFASTFPCRASGARQGRVGASAGPAEREKSSVAARECELRDRSAGDLRRHEADIVFYHHILPPAIRPAQGVELQVCLLSGSKIDGSGLAGIKRHEAGSGNNVMPGRNIAVETPPSCSYPTVTP